MPALRTRSDSLSTSLPFEQLTLSKPHSGPNYTHAHAANMGLEVSITSTDEEPSIGIVSPTPRAFTFSQNNFTLDHLDGPTPRAFTFPEHVHDSLRALPISTQSQSRQRLASSDATVSTPSTSPSPFHDDNSSSPSPELARLAISSRRPSLQVAMQRTESPVAQINPFNAFEPSLATGPITLAHRRRGSSISSLQLGPTVSPHAQAPPQTHTLALGGIGLPERRPKRGDEDYIKRPENAFILFRRDCCQKRNADEAAAAANGTEDPNVRRQRQADLSKTISQQWRSLSAEERKYWDELAKQRKKEHEEMYPWYVYQPSRSKEKKAKGKGGEDEIDSGVIVEEKKTKSRREGKEKERREERKKGRKERREKSHSRVRSSHGNGLRSRNQSACSTTSTASSCSTVDSDDFDSGSEAFAGRYRAFQNDMDMGEMDFEMTDSESSASFNMALPPGLAMSQQFQLSTQNPMAQFAGHAHHGHGHSLSAQIPAQQIQHLGPPLSFVLPQNRRSTSAPGAPSPPPQPNSYPSIKLPQLLSTNASSSSSPVLNEDAEQLLAPPVEINSSTSSPDSRASSEGINQEQQTLQSFQFPPNTMGQMNFADLSGHAPVYSNANNDVPPNQMYSMYEQRMSTTIRSARPRALTQLSIPHTPSVGGPLSAPAHDQSVPQLTSPSSANSSAPITPNRLYLPNQPQHLSPSSAIAHMHHGPVRAMPMNLPESPKPGHDWDAYELPAWALSTLCPTPGDESHAAQQHHSSPPQMQQQQQSDSTPTPDHAQSTGSNNDEGMDAMGNSFLMAPPSGEIEIDFSGIPFSFDNFTMGTGEPGMDLMGGFDDVDPLLGIQFHFDDLLDPSQL